MRVITGTARGVRLQTLEGEQTRPTADKVKEGLFSALQFDIEGRRVLDLFAGSGALGIEALSRGAAHCTFVDSNRKAADIVRQNLQQCRLSDQATVLCTDAAAFLMRGQRFDAALLDPPYASGLAVSLLPALAPCIAAGGWVACETAADTAMPQAVGDLVLHRTYRYGTVQVSVYFKG